MGRRRDIVIAISPTSWDYDQVAIEIAWQRQNESTPTVFVAPHTADDIVNGSEDVFEQIGYESLNLGDHSKWDNDGEQLRLLHRALRNYTVTSCNAVFDSAMLSRLFLASKEELHKRPWFRFVDLASYAAGCLNMSPNQLPSLESLCKRLGTEWHGHTASSRVIAASECLAKLRPTSK